METATITPHLGGRVWFRSIQYPSLDTPVTVTDFSGIGRKARTGVFPVKGRSAPISVHDVRGSQEFTVEVTTDTPLAELRMDAILALGGPMFLHVPADCPVPGGYVAIGDTDAIRRTRSARSDRRYFTLPCTVVTAPAPDVVGTTVTWGTIYNLYGSWEAVYAAHPAYRGPDGLLELVGDPEDLFAP
jgi:hypothetical protein